MSPPEKQWLRNESCCKLIDRLNEFNLAWPVGISGFLTNVLATVKNISSHHRLVQMNWTYLHEDIQRLTRSEKPLLRNLNPKHLPRAGRVCARFLSRLSCKFCCAMFFLIAAERTAYLSKIWGLLMAACRRFYCPSTMPASSCCPRCSSACAAPRRSRVSRFWLSLDFARTRVNVISTPTIACSMVAM